jgi:hypothetical protein
MHPGKTGLDRICYRSRNHGAGYGLHVFYFTCIFENLKTEVEQLHFICFPTGFQ